ncbi:hypothetical protein TWF718_005356 [Orbilia javanica]|uniref:BTB domain-containing protein n=1 Tax=Orbilia javanica TaxID=47235 RepID=A0AAN8RDI0_9PEZI
MYGAVVRTKGGVKEDANANAIPERVFPRWSERAPDHNTILTSILADSTFSDVTVIVGPKEQPFKLHRAVITIESNFFKIACKPGPGAFKESVEGKIFLPEIEPREFSTVVAWQYGQHYFPKWTLGEGDLALFQAVEYLQIASLRDEILRSMVLLCQRSLLDTPLDDIDIFVNNFAKLCEFCREADLPVLVEIMTEIIYYWDPSVQKLFDGSKKGVYGPAFLAALVSAQRPFASENLDLEKTRPYSFTVC